MFKVILSTLTPLPTEDSNGGDSTDSKSDDNTMGDSDLQDLMDSMEGDSNDGSNDDMGGTSIDNLPDNMSGGYSSQSNSTPTKEVTLSDRQKELLGKKIQKQKDFIDGEVKKKSISKADSKNLDNIDESGSEIKSVGKDHTQGYGTIGRGVECIVVKKLTKNLLESELFPLTTNTFSSRSESPIRYSYNEEVQNGIKLGTILGKKLQVRGEDRNTVFNRQRIGKIDKRMISSLGFGNENVFQYMETDSYKKANLHISIDASGSMGGEKWENTLTNVVAMCKAVDMISNLTIQVSFRTTTYDKPYIVMAYDSRSDKFSKVKQMFGALTPNGTTPEGLCFEAILKNFLASNNDMDSYFLNLSDGAPYFQGRGFYYSGYTAAEHTKKMVKKIEDMGIKTLSYFISDSKYYGSAMDYFKIMYGSSSQQIDVTNLSQVTKSMNRLFLQK